MSYLFIFIFTTMRIEIMIVHIVVYIFVVPKKQVCCVEPEGVCVRFVLCSPAGAYQWPPGASSGAGYRWLSLESGSTSLSSSLSRTVSGSSVCDTSGNSAG